MFCFRVIATLAFAGVVVLTAGPEYARGQATGAIAGQVADEGGEPLPGANVIVEGTQRGAATDRNGRFRLRNVPAGEQTLVITFVGYETEEVAVTVQSGATVEENIQLTLQAVEAEEIIVEGQRDILRTLERKRSAQAIVDVLDLESVQRLPVQDMTEALDRLPAVNIQGQSAGRGFRSSFVVVRGIQPNLNNVTIMGVPLVSTQADRAVALDILPSNMAAQVEVSKAITPDMDANTIGGSVNIVPLSAFDRRGPYVFGSIESGTNEEAGALTSPQAPVNANVLASTRIGEDWGVAASLNYNQEEFSRTFVEPDSWAPIPQPGFSNDLYVPEGTRLEQTQSGYDRYSGTVSLEWRPNADRNIQVLSSYTESTNEEISTQTEWNYADGKDEIAFERRSATEIFSPTGENEKEMDIDEQTESMFFMIGQGEFRFDNLLWTVSGSYVRSESDEEVREWAFNSINFPSVIDMSGTIPWAEPVDREAFIDPANYTFNEIDIEPWEKAAESIQVGTDLRYDFEALGEGGFLKAGALYRPQETSADRDELQYEYDPDSGFPASLADLGIGTTLDDIAGLPVSPLIDPERGPAFIDNNPDVLFFNEAASIDDRIEGDWNVNEDVVAGYAMGSGTYGALEVTGGVRLEYTETETIVKTFDENTERFGEEVFTNDYVDVLPNLHLRYRINDELQVRAAGTFTIARPGLVDLGRSRSVDYDNSDIVEGTGVDPIRVSDADVEQGNPQLKPFESLNLDATLEYYRRRGSFYMVGGFYKNIDNPIFTQSIERRDITLADTRYNRLTFEQPLNAASGDLLGLEAQIQETFTFLPGPLRGLGVTSNAALLSSDFTIPGREGEDLPFFRQPDVVLAVTPFWQYRGFEARLSYQYTDEYVVSFGSDPLQDQFVDAREVFDLQVMYTLANGVTATAGVENLTLSPFRTYQGRDNRPTDINQFGRFFWLGLRARL